MADTDQSAEALKGVGPDAFHRHKTAVLVIDILGDPYASQAAGPGRAGHRECSEDLPSSACCRHAGDLLR